MAEIALRAFQNISFGIMVVLVFLALLYGLFGVCKKHPAPSLFVLISGTILFVAWVIGELLRNVRVF